MSMPGASIINGLVATTRETLAGGRRAAPGVAISLAVALVALFLGSHYAAPVMLFALLLGMTLGFLRDWPRVTPGIRLSTRTLLRIGVALLGARLTLADLTALGLAPVLITLTTVTATLITGFIVARGLGMSRHFGVLSAGAVSICGASAALAIASTLPRDERAQLNTVLVVVSVSTLSTVALVLYPLLAAQLGMDDAQAGVFLGATIHDVAQVVGAGFSVSESSGETATVIKLLRVALLLPLVVGLAIVTRPAAEPGAPDAPRRRFMPPIPGFLLGFLALVSLNSLGGLPDGAQAILATISGACLITAVAALGIQSHLGELLKLGWRPVTVIVLQTLFMGALGAMLVSYWLGG